MNNQNNFKSKKMTTSKYISYILIFAYILQMAFSNFAMVKYNCNLSFLLTYSTPLVTLVLLSYFGKASMENHMKIKGSMNNVFQQSNDLMNNFNENINANQNNQEQIYSDPSEMYKNNH